jgi:TolB-like protein/Flp pilus assembly protein TadD
LSLIKELKRRNVFKVAIAYIVMAWLVMQVADVILNNIEAPNWVFLVILLVLGIGFLLALFFAWAFEITSEGLKREHEVDRSQSIAPQTSKKLNNLIVTFMALALAYFAYDKFVLSDSREAVLVEATTQAISEQALSAEVPAEPIKSIAVLPFANRSANPDDAFFVDGIHDDLLTYISQIGSLKTISRTSVMQYRGTTKSIPQIARELDVGAVLEGGVQRAGEQVRINVQLINAHTDDHLWSEIYDRQLTATNIFSIQSEIAEAVAEALRATLTPANKQRIRNVPTQSMSALEMYFLGKQLMGRRSTATLAKAVDHFNDAISIDPDFALVYVGLADSYRLQANYAGFPHDDMDAKGQVAVDRALQLDPLLGEAHTSQANLKRRSGDLEGAEVAFKRALELNPNYAPAYQWYAEMLTSMSGRTADALELSRAAVTLDPLSPIIRNDYAEVFERAGRFDDAMAQYKKAIEIDPDFAVSHRQLGDLFWTAYEQLDEAVFSYKRSYAADPDGLRGPSGLVQIYMDLGDMQQAGFWFQRYLELADSSRPSSLFAWFPLYFWDEAKALEYASKRFAITPRSWSALAVLGNHDLKMGDFGKARARYQQAYPELFDGSEPEIDQPNYEITVNLASVLIKTGEREKAEKLLDRSSSLIKEYPRLGGYGYGITDVQIHALRGDKEKALAALRQAINQGWRYYWWYYLEHDPTLQLLSGEPGFQTMREEIKADMAEQLARLREREVKDGLATAAESLIESH